MTNRNEQDSSINTKSTIATSRKAPAEITDPAYMFPAFLNNEVLLNIKKGQLPAMGWNSWNAFGSKNSEALTKEITDKLVELGLADLGYKYVVLDDGCYKSERIDGLLANETVKFPSGFKALSDYIHEKGLLFGMYNDIGTNLCAGAAVGTCGFEDVDAQSYVDWGVDLLKVDNCYYLWDDATFSDETNAKYTFAPNIRSITLTGNDVNLTLNAVKDGTLLGKGAFKHEDDFVSNIGTFDGTHADMTPVGDLSSELSFTVNVPTPGEYTVTVNYASAEEVGTGRWLQMAVGDLENEKRYFDEMLPLTETKTTFTDSEEITISLTAGENTIRLMNHRRQENTLNSYAALLAGLNAADPNHEIALSICEWGKTQPQHWGYKVGTSWRILNDITFNVGSDGDPGKAVWADDYTASITSQYNKNVIMDEFSGLDKGWNDPDMLVIGMNGITETMNETHMAMWCMMNAPLMLGMDLRNVAKGDATWEVISNKGLIDLNQDPLGVQAKRIYCSLDQKQPDQAYIKDNNRFDIIAKPLENGDVALSFINLSEEKDATEHAVDVKHIIDYIGDKMVAVERFKNAENYTVTDLWTGDKSENTTGVFSVKDLEAHDNVTIRVRAN